MAEIIGTIVIIWQLLSWIIDKFGIWIVLIILIINYKNVFLTIFLIWNSLFKNYCSSYPVFSRAKIADEEYIRIKANIEGNKAWNKFEKFFKKYKNPSKDEVIKIAGIHQEAYYTNEVASEVADKKMNLMIEGNNAVQNGKKTIEEVRKELYALFEYMGKYGQRTEEVEVKKRYEEWVNGIRNPKKD